MAEKQRLARRANEPRANLPDSDSDFETHEDVYTPRTSVQGNAPDLPPTYEESQAALRLRANPAPPGIVNHSDITVYRTEIPPDPPIEVPVQRSEPPNSDEKTPIPPHSDGPRASRLLNEALRFTENPPPSAERPPLQTPVSIPSLARNSGPIKFARFYAPALDSRSVAAAEFIDFLDGLNALSTASNFSLTTYQSRNALSPYEVSRDDENIEREDLVSAYIALSNSHFFHPRGLHIQITDLTQLADMLNISNAAIRKTILQEVLRMSRTGIDVPAAANGAAHQAAEALIPYIESLTTAVPEPKKHQEALEAVANRFAQIDLQNEDVPPYDEGNTRQETSSSSSAGPSRVKSWDEWGRDIGAFWQDWGEKKGKWWEQWGEQQGRKWGKWGEEFGRKMSAGPPWAQGSGAGAYIPDQRGFGGHRGGGPFGRNGGPPFGPGGGLFARHGSGPFGAGGGPFGASGSPFGAGGGPFGRGGSPFGRAGCDGGRGFGRHGSWGGRGGPWMVPPVPGINIQPGQPGQPAPPAQPAPPPMPHGIPIPPIPGLEAVRGLHGIHQPPPNLGSHGTRDSLEDDDEDDQDFADIADTLSLSSSSSSSSSSSDKTYVHDGDGDDIHAEHEALFTQKVAKVEAMAEAARSKNAKPAHEIELERSRALHALELEHSRAEQRYHHRLQKRELKRDIHAWKRGLKNEFKAAKHMNKAQRREWKRAKKEEWRGYKGQLKEYARSVKEEKRARKRELKGLKWEGKRKDWESKREGKRREWESKREEWQSKREGKKKDWEGRRGGPTPDPSLSSVNDVSRGIAGGSLESLNEEIEGKAREMLWVVVTKFEE